MREKILFDEMLCLGMFIGESNDWKVERASKTHCRIQGFMFFGCENI